MMGDVNMLFSNLKDVMFGMMLGWYGSCQLQTGKRCQQGYTG